MEVQTLNCEDFGNFLEAEGFHKDIVSRAERLNRFYD